MEEDRDCPTCHIIIGFVLLLAIAGMLIAAVIAASQHVPVPSM